MVWTDEMIAFLTENYPKKGKAWCVTAMNLKEHQIRYKASHLKLRQDMSSEFFQDWQTRAAQSKVGKKRPEQAAVIKKAIHDKGDALFTPERRSAVGKRIKEWIAKNGHVRGYLGMKHSDETRAVLGQKSKAHWDSMSEEMRDEYSMRASIAGQKSAQNRENASWKAAWREIGGVRKYFRSAWEANYARYLEWLKGKGEILSWEHEPETFWFEGIKRGCMSYLPDFRVIAPDETISYHEVKGWMDDRSKTKIKRMAKYYPNVNLLVIDSRAYKALEKSVSPLIEGWEFKVRT